MMLCENNFYRTSDGLLDIEFLFVDMGNTIGWRAYILTDINYQMISSSRSDSAGTVHRLIESSTAMQSKIRNFMQTTRSVNYATNNVIRYICWDKPIHNLENMREIAKTWSEITAYYIKHGGSFGSIQPLLKSQGKISL